MAEPSAEAERVAACGAPSREIRHAQDARDAQALAACAFAPPPAHDVGERCGQAGYDAPISLERLDDAVLALDAVTRAHVLRIAARGRAKGRRARVFGLVGDSITHTDWFLRPLSRPERTTLSEAVRARLMVKGEMVIDVVRGLDAHVGLDPFVAPRAAKNGARASWVLPVATAPDHTPLGRLVKQLSPSIAIVLFGSNHSTERFTPLHELVAEFRSQLERIVDYLEAEGIVVVLNTVPRHGVEPGRPDCDRREGDLSNWRIAVQASALSAEMVAIACERALPLIDLRYALDALPNDGLGPDGIHPIAHISGAGRLDEHTLACGMNTRNYVTLRMLAQLYEAMADVSTVEAMPQSSQ